MAFLPAFGKPFQNPVATSAAVTPWYRAGGAPMPVAAYQPKGAASLAASYINLANPGTYDAAPGTAPTWNTATGWTFAPASFQYLKTGLIDTAVFAGDKQTAIVQYTGCAGGVGIFGARLGAFNREFYIAPTAGIRYANGDARVDVVPALAAGNVAVSNKCYRNGVSENAQTGTTRNGIEIYIGAYNNAGAPVYANVTIVAIAFYAAWPTDTQILAVSTAMALI